MTQASQSRRAQADKSLATIEHELESRRHEAEAKAEEILSSARTEARRMLADAEKQASEYDGQLRFLNLRKQQFLKDAYSLLADFGKVIERAQEELDSEMEEESMSGSRNAVHEDMHEDMNDTHSVLEFAPESHEDVSAAPDAPAEEN